MCEHGWGLLCHIIPGVVRNRRDARGGPKKGHIHMHEFESVPLPTIDISTHFSTKNDCSSTIFFSVLSKFSRCSDRFSYFHKLHMKNPLDQSCNSGDIQKKSKTYNFLIKINIFLDHSNHGEDEKDFHRRKRNKRTGLHNDH